MQNEETGSWGDESVIAAFEILGPQLALYCTGRNIGPRDDEPTWNLVLLS
jgi:hypothetical protein